MDAGSGSSSKPKGCYLSQTAGFVLLLMTIVLVVSVGLLVHFTAKSVNCNCVYSGATSEPDSKSQDLQVQFCNSLGEKVRTCEYKVFITFDKCFKQI